MKRWQRPYSLDRQTIMAYAVTVFFGFGVVGIAVIWPLGLAVVALTIYVPILVFTALSTRVGLFVSDVGVRSRGRLSVRTVPWSQIAHIGSGYVTYFGSVTGRRGIVLDLVDGTSVMTPIRLRLPWRLSAVNERNDVTGVSVEAALYDHILETMRHLLASHGGGAPRPAAAVRPAVSPPASRPAADAKAQLHTLQRMRQRGSITEEEYAALRDRLTG